MASFARGLASPQLAALVTLASAMTLGIGLIVWTMQPEYVPLSEQASRQDVLSIVESLESSQIDYKIDPSTGIVLVPRDQLTQIQLSLAASGLSESNEIGLELLNQEPSLGISHFTETARYQRALEIELSRTISGMRNVESARVHLALPKQSVFIRDREQASGSVMIKAKQGRTLEDEQINSVVNLVASSIPFLEADRVTVVDQWGRLLSTGTESTVGARREHYQYARKLENLYAERIETLLTPIVGRGRVRATVTAEFDFSSNEQTQELFEPDPTQLRSEQLSDQRSTGAAAGGIPGALTNQPPAAGNTEVDAAEGGAQLPGGSESSNAVRNYELDKTITHTRQGPGEIRRLSAAVIIDNQEIVDADGNVTSQALDAADIEEYVRLVREAIGFNEARGDSVLVFNRPFQAQQEIAPLEPLPLWEQSWLWTMVKQSLIGLSVLLLVLLVLRPAVKRLNLTPAPALVDKSEEDEDAEAEDDEENEDTAKAAAKQLQEEKPDPSLPSPPVVYGDILNMARAMAADDPKRVAMLVKDWVSDQ